MKTRECDSLKENASETPCGRHAPPAIPALPSPARYVRGKSIAKLFDGETEPTSGFECAASALDASSASCRTPRQPDCAFTEQPLA